MRLACARRTLDLSSPAVMGILNVTPNSFSDGGRFADPGAALTQARRMVADGAAIIDVGGESTRPGAAPASLQEELDRVVPVVEAITRELDVVVSIDTMKPEVMRAAVAAGAGLINDVLALQAPGAIETAAASGAAVCLMHMQGTPRTMQQDPHYEDVVREVGDFLHERAGACRAAGIPADRIALDPGFGFGKTLEHNLTLLRHLPDLVINDRPLLIGVSRKSMIGKVIHSTDMADRYWPTVALTAHAREHGARIIRVHDVKPNAQALRMIEAIIHGA